MPSYRMSIGQRWEREPSFRRLLYLIAGATPSHTRLTR